VRTLDEVYKWDQVHSQGLMIDVEHEVLGKISIPGAPLRFFGPADAEEVTNTSHRAPPTLNQHGPAIRQWLAESQKEA